MPNRIAFRYVDSADAVQHFTCDINPLIADLQFGLSPTMEQTVDGEPIVFLPGFDSRTRTLKWAKLPQKTPYTTMINNIKELEGLTSGCQIQRNDLDDGAGPGLSPVQGHALCPGHAHRRAARGRSVVGFYSLQRL